MAGVIYEDFIRPHLKKPVSETKASLILKVFACLIGIITVLLASLADRLGGIIQVGNSVLTFTYIHVV